MPGTLPGTGLPGTGLPGRTLFVRAGALGDFVLTLPVLDRLLAGAARARAAGLWAEVVAAVPERFIPLLPGPERGPERVWKLDRTEAGWIYAPGPERIRAPGAGWFMEPCFTPESSPPDHPGASPEHQQRSTETFSDSAPESVEHRSVKHLLQRYPPHAYLEPPEPAPGYDRIVCFSAIIADTWADAGMAPEAIWARRGLPDSDASVFYMGALPTHIRDIDTCESVYSTHPVGNTDIPADIRVAPADIRVAPADIRVAPADIRVAPADIRVAPADIPSPPSPPLSLPVSPPVSPPLYVISPGSGGASKRWPVERWQEVEALLEAAGARCVWCLGPVEEGESWRWQPNPRTGRPMRVVTPDLRGMIMLAGEAAGWLGPDSGPLHLAASAGCPALALFLTTDPAIWGPPGALAVDGRASPPSPAGIARLALTALPPRRRGRWP